MALNSSSLFFSNHLHPVYQHSFSSAKWREQCCQDYLGACPSSSLTEIDQHLKVWKQAPKTLAFKWTGSKVQLLKISKTYSLSTWYFLLKRSFKFALKLSMTCHWPCTWVLHNNIFKNQLQKVKHQTFIATRTRSIYGCLKIPEKIGISKQHINTFLKNIIINLKRWLEQCFLITWIKNPTLLV